MSINSVPFPQTPLVNLDMQSAGVVIQVSFVMFLVCRTLLVYCHLATSNIVCSFLRVQHKVCLVCSNTAGSVIVEVPAISLDIAGSWSN